MKLINGMEPERYLASLLLANSNYKGEKYYNEKRMRDCNKITNCRE